jgi:hypothetical protein
MALYYWRSHERRSACRDERQPALTRSDLPLIGSWLQVPRLSQPSLMAGRACCPFGEDLQILIGKLDGGVRERDRICTGLCTLLGTVYV